MTRYIPCPNCGRSGEPGWRCQTCGAIRGYYPFEILLVLVGLLVIVTLLLFGIAAIGATYTMPPTRTPRPTPFPTATTSPLPDALGAFQMGRVPEQVDVVVTLLSLEDDALHAAQIDGRFVLAGLDIADRRLTYRSGRDEPLTTYRAFISDVANPVWSPDGRRFAVSGVVAGARDIFVVEDGHACKVTDSDTPASQPQWSPDGRELAYVADRSLRFTSSDCAITDDVRGQALEGDVVAFSWSAENILAVVSSSAERREIVFIDSGNGASQTLRISQPVANVYWNPQGNILALVGAEENPSLALLFFGPNGVTAEIVARADVIYGVAWSPDGASLIISARFSSEGWLPMHYDVESKELRPLLDFPEFSSIDWAP